MPARQGPTTGPKSAVLSIRAVKPSVTTGWFYFYRLHIVGKFVTFAVMKRLKKQKIGENLLYLMVWAAIILVPILNDKMLDEEHVDLMNIMRAWCREAPYLFIFIVHNSFLAPRLLLKHRYVPYMGAMLMLQLAVFGFIEANDFSFELTDGGRDGLHKASFTDLAMHWNMLLGLFMCGANASIKLLYQSLRDEQHIEELEYQNLQAELDYLKYQINPHFFMNTLNNIHALIDIDTEEAKNTVIELSKMMRYVLYDSGHRSITLQQDLQFLSNYINLMKIRYSDDLDIRIDTPDRQWLGVRIPPLLLIVFVENAFKHGVSSTRPSFIHLKIETEGEHVLCRIVNSRQPERSKDEGSGIGLKNVKKRLELIYDKNFDLQIDTSDPMQYAVTLKIPTLHA